jgi:hypothetical protein
MHVYNCLVSGAFHPPSGALFRFPSPYWCAIGLDEYLALEAAGSLLPIAYSSYGTQAEKPSSSRPTPTGLSPSMADHSRSLRVSPDWRERFRLNTTSQACHPRLFRFGLIPFHSPLLRESRFDFLSSAYSDASFRRVPPPSLRRVFPGLKPREGYPFSDPRINGCMLLPGAYRRLPRPSSAVEPIHPPGSVHVPRPQLPVGTVCDLPVTHSQPNTFGLMHSPKRKA